MNLLFLIFMFIISTKAEFSCYSSHETALPFLVDEKIDTVKCSTSCFVSKY